MLIRGSRALAALIRRNALIQSSETAIAIQSGTSGRLAQWQMPATPNSKISLKFDMILLGAGSDDSRLGLGIGLVGLLSDYGLCPSFGRLRRGSEAKRNEFPFYQ